MNFFGEKYKFYLLVPGLLLILFIFLVFFWPGLSQGIDLRGGTSLIIRTDKSIDAKKLEAILEEKFTLRDLTVITVGNGTIIEFAHNDVLVAAQEQLDQAKSSLKENNLETAKASALKVLATVKPFIDRAAPSGMNAEALVEFARIALVDAKEEFQKRLQETIKTEFGLGEEVRFQKKEVGAALGANFWANALKVGVTAIIFIIIVIFAFFREFAPSLMVILAAVFDVLGALAGMALFGIGLGLASIPALLMLVGYSVDTDILLTSRVMKRREGTTKERALDSMKTGMTMTLTTMAAVSVMTTISYFSQMTIIFEIGMVVIFGLIADLVSTWLMNAPMLLWFMERREKKVVY